MTILTFVKVQNFDKGISSIRNILLIQKHPIGKRIPFVRLSAVEALLIQKRQWQHPISFRKIAMIFSSDEGGVEQSEEAKQSHNR
jgi:hypothetical protein